MRVLGAVQEIHISTLRVYQVLYASKSSFICQTKVNLNLRMTTMVFLGNGFVVFVRESDCAQAVRAEKIHVFNSTHSSTLYISPHGGAR